MKLDKSYKVKVNPEPSLEIQELVFKNGGKWCNGSQEVFIPSYKYLVLELRGNLIYLSSLSTSELDVVGYKEITAPELITLLSQDEKETKMTNLADFENCKQVRCIESNPSHGLKKGEIYDVISTEYTKLGFGEWLHIRISKDGEKNSYLSGFFEPVIETAIQASNALDDTPMDTRTVNEFEVGDRVYFPAVSSKVITLPALQDGRFGVVSDYGNKVFIFPNGTYHNGNVAPYIVKATSENYEMLCNLYPNIEFEAPAKELTGSDLCRAMLDKGWKYVPCYVDDYSEKVEDLFFRAITKYDKDSFYCEQDGRWTYAVPFDPKTGNVLTSEVLDD